MEIPRYLGSSATGHLLTYGPSGLSFTSPLLSCLTPATNFKGFEFWTRKGWEESDGWMDGSQNGNPRENIIIIVIIITSIFGCK